MSLDTLSAVLEKQIRSLHLRDFPCGEGRWREAGHGADGVETESVDALLDLLSCPRSPWWRDETWSPQAASLRRQAVLTPQHLHARFIHTYLTVLRVVNRNVSVVDDGLLKFSKLEQLVLSANQISEIPAENLPPTLKILELCANQLSSLSSLTTRALPHLQHLGLSANPLGSPQDIASLAGIRWPQLVSLDLSDCEFQHQQDLLNALRSFPWLKTLVLERNPLTLAPSYPGVTVDSLPQLCYLDSTWISSEERLLFKGLAKMRDVTVDVAAATVNVGRMRGIPDPIRRMEEKPPDFPVVTYRYFITYEFLSHQTSTDVVKEVNSETEHEKASTARETEGGLSEAKLGSDCNRDPLKTPTENSMASTESGFHRPRVLKHSTSRLPWSESMDFSHTQTHTTKSLGDLKKFLRRGMCVRLEEEMVLSWPAPSENASAVKPKRSVKKKDVKEKESLGKSAHSKDKKKPPVLELVHDAPVRRILGSAHVSLQSLVSRGQRVQEVCNVGTLHTESQPEVIRALRKDVVKNVKEQKRKVDLKHQGGSRIEVRNTKAKIKGKDEGEDDVPRDPVCIQPESITVEMSVELEKWQSAAEAHLLWLPF